MNVKDAKTIETRPTLSKHRLAEFIQVISDLFFSR